MDYKIKTFRYRSEDYQKALDLRWLVLRKPLALKFTERELKKDREDTHFGLFEEEKILACVTLTKINGRRIKMRQVAVDENYQGKGLGSELSKVAEKYAIEKKFKIICCNARKTAVPFYEKLGYKIVSDEFIEVTIPHYTMEKHL